MPSIEINPAKVVQFRTLHFQTVGDCLEEVERIQRAAVMGELQSHGNWSPSQILTHLAAWIEYAYVGFPIPRPPKVIAWILRTFMRKRLLSGKSMPRGIRIPKVAGGTTGADDIPFDQAVVRYRAALERLQSVEEAPYPSPAFGPMNHGERIQLNLRHAELHLGYLEY